MAIAITFTNATSLQLYPSSILSLFSVSLSLTLSHPVSYSQCSSLSAPSGKAWATYTTLTHTYSIREREKKEKHDNKKKKKETKKKTEEEEKKTPPLTAIVFDIHARDWRGKGGRPCNAEETDLGPYDEGRRTHSYIVKSVSVDAHLLFAHPLKKRSAE